MSRFVQRFEGKIIADYANFQAGFAEEDISEDHAEFLAYKNPPPSVEDYKAAIVAHLDAKAQERRYDNAVSIATYTDSTNPTWIAEALAFVAWRDAVWVYAYAELDKVMSGERLQPTIAELVAELPEMVWP